MTLLGRSRARRCGGGTAGARSSFRSGSAAPAQGAAHDDGGRHDPYGIAILPYRKTLTLATG
ncbi:hypothetical protein, partial [Streptomyces geysiriensis]|uniref:hypothetical protein n=1 Tax=Streptomyces geysiriensis TaxID=68207 RepID=UPI001C7CB643